jgi:cellulose biosynthesis protein BcsQ
MGRVVVVLSRKGGVGKTTLVGNLAAAATSGGSSVALVDTDTQGTLSRWALGRDRLDRVTPAESVRVLTRVNSGSPGVVLTAVNSADDRPSCCHQAAPIPGSVIVPVSPSIRLDDVVSINLQGLADNTVVDTPPDCGSKLVHAVIQNATDVVVPVAPELWSLEAVPEVLGSLRDAGRDDLVERVTIVLNMRMRNAVHDALETILRQMYGRQASDVVFPRAVVFAEAAFKRTVVSPKTANGKLFATLWKSITAKSARRAA